MILKYLLMHRKAAWEFMTSLNSVSVLLTLLSYCTYWYLILRWQLPYRPLQYRSIHPWPYQTLKTWGSGSHLSLCLSYLIPNIYGAHPGVPAHLKFSLLYCCTLLMFEILGKKQFLLYIVKQYLVALYNLVLCLG